MENWSSREVGDCLVSTGGNWLQTPGSNRLFVRPCYSALFQECQTLFRSNIQGVFLMGTPGIGKSCFLDYALHRFLKDGKSVLYLHGPRDRAFVFQHVGGGTITVTEHNLTAVLNGSVEIPSDAFDIVFYDPHESAARTNDVHISFFGGKKFIVAMSPDKDNCKKLRKDTNAQAKLYMGTYSLQEAEALRSSCYPHVPTDTLHTRYAVMGGIARHLIRVFPDRNDPALAEIRGDQVAALNIIVANPVIIDAGEVDSQFKSLWSIYHLQPMSNADGETDYYDYTIELCCDDARIRIRDMLMRKEVNDLWHIYDTTIEQQGTLRGIRYEAYAHKKILAAGLHGNASSLTQNGIGTSTTPVSIPASLPKITLPDNELGVHLQDAVNHAKGLPNGGYLLPHCSNFPVIDSIFVSSAGTLLLQMKAGRSKPLSEDSATTICNIVGDDLVFIVPDEVTMRRKLQGGPPGLKQYRFVLRGETHD